jgi:carbon storage regulator
MGVSLPIPRLIVMRSRRAPEYRMLILSRKVHQEIVIGDGISITIVAIRGKQVRVGIKAPLNVPIRRDELAPLPPHNGRAKEGVGLK